MESKNTILDKIKAFFSNLFKPKYETLPMPKEEQYEDVKPSISLASEIEENRNKKEMAEKLLSSEVMCSELDDSEIDEMMDYFTKDIESMDRELLRIKSNIMSMKKQLALQ